MIYGSSFPTSQNTQNINYEIRWANGRSGILRFLIPRMNWNCGRNVEFFKSGGIYYYHYRDLRNACIS